MSDTTIKDSVKRLAGTFNKSYAVSLLCTVSSVDESTRTCTCTPVSDGYTSDITNVLLMAEVDDGFLLVPVIGSTVLVSYSKRNVPYIALFSEIERVILVTVSGFQLQGGEFGGLVIIEKLLEKINTLENTVNSLNAKLNTLSPTPVIPPITVTARTELENDSITHGK